VNRRPFVFSLLLLTILLPCAARTSQTLKREVLSDALKDLEVLVPEPVSVSPSGRWLVKKQRLENVFVLEITERRSGKKIASSVSSQSQLALSWSPDSLHLAWLQREKSNCGYRLHLMSIQSGKDEILDSPSTQTAWPSIAWSPDSQRFSYFEGNFGSGNLVVYSLAKLPKVNVLGKGDSLTEFVWFDGESLIAVSGSWLVRYRLDGSHESLMNLPEGSSFRNLAVKKGTKKCLVTCRLKDREYFELFELDIASRDFKRIVTFQGDILHPKWFERGNSYVFEVDAKGLRQLFVVFANANPRAIGKEEARNEIFQIVGEKVYFGVTALSQPVSLAAWDSKSRTTRVFASRSRLTDAGCPPEKIDLSRSALRRLPALLWKSTGPSLVVWVHGGPHLSFSPVYDRGVQHLVRRGVSVLAVNYRGSSGYGHRFESEWTLENVIDDIHVAVNFGIARLNVKPERIFIFAESVGLIPALDYTRQYPDEWGGLVSLAGIAKASQVGTEPKGKTVLGFQGALDCESSSENTRETLSKAFGGKIALWQEFSEEGHHFSQPGSWAKIYAAVFETL
jgi:dipeptidyl aminopeptidase/acylaminoacyl peptidase